MKTAADGHNLPRKFYTCAVCGKKGVYELGVDTVVSRRGLRCKFCQHEKWIEREQWMGLEAELPLFPYETTKQGQRPEGS